MTVTSAARRFRLSRSTLLYYHRLGLLRPSARSAAGYRLYGETDLARLEAICRYRAVGVPLEAIPALLKGGASEAAAILTGRLDAVNAEIARLREQQRVLVRLLGNRRAFAKARAMDKDAWVALLRASGLSDEDLNRWHAEFERQAPEAHEDFLASLGIPPAERTLIRKRSRRARKS